MARRVRGCAAGALALSGALTGVPGASAAPPEPVPVRATERDEGAPTAYGALVGWTDEGTGRVLVSRGSGRPVQVSARGTVGDNGVILGRRVLYAQRVVGRPPRIFRYDLVTGTRSPLPPAVNQGVRRTPRGPERILLQGDLSASGSKVLYDARINDPAVGTFYSVPVLYDRVTRKRRVLDFYDLDDLLLGQLNGRYATWTVSERITDGPRPAGAQTIHRRDITTGRELLVESAVYDDAGGYYLGPPGVGADGTLYYWRQASGQPAELVRDAARRPPVVLVTGTRRGIARNLRASDVFVRDRRDGSVAVFYTVSGPGSDSAGDTDIFKVVDRARIEE